MPTPAAVWTTSVERRWGYGAVLLAAVLWGLLGPVSRVAYAAGVEPQEVAFWRAVLGGALFGVHALALRRLRIARRDLPVVAVFGLCGVALLFASYQLAIRAGGAALAAVLLYTAPAWVALLTWLLRLERMDRVKLTALGLALVGVALVSLGHGGGVHLSAAALFWGLLSGFAYALYYLFGKRYFPRYPSPTLFFPAFLVGALGLLPAVHFHPKPPAAWAAVIFLGVFSTYGAYFVYSLGLARLEATRAATVATLEPVVAGAVAFAWWGELLSPSGYLGAGLILAGVVLVAWQDRQDLPRRVAEESG